MPDKTLSAFAHFYATDLVKDLKQLEIMRKAVLHRVIILGAVMVGIVGVAVAIDFAYRLTGWIIFIAIALCGSTGPFLYKFLTSDYVHAFKVRVISKIVAFLDPGLEYAPGGYIEQWKFVSSRIFERHPDRYTGDDYIRGKVGETNVELCELHAEYKEEGYSSRGGRRRRWHTIFRGLFFTADFNKNFYGKTVVLPDTAEKLLGSAGTFFQSLNKSRGDLMKMDDPEFEKLFVVYGDDQIESRYVLSTSLMERIVGFRKKTGRPIYLSFVSSQVFVAISYRGGLFEPKVFSSITDFKCMEDYYDNLHLALGIVADLDLNTRIWTKAPAPPASPAV
jgi:hypothetical protein